MHALSDLRRNECLVALSSRRIPTGILQKSSRKGANAQRRKGKVNHEGHKGHEEEVGTLVLANDH